MVDRVGFEPTINGLKVRCLKPDLATDLYDVGFGIADLGFILNPQSQIPNPKSEIELADSTRFALAFHRLTVGCFLISYEPKNLFY